MNTYIFSYYAKQPVAIIKRRPWLAFWRYDTLAYEDQWVRKAHHIPQKEADVIIEESNLGYDTPVSALLLRLMGKDLKMLQLERNNIWPTGTISTSSEYVSTGRSVTNELANSLDAGKPTSPESN